MKKKIKTGIIILSLIMVGLLFIFIEKNMPLMFNTEQSYLKHTLLTKQQLADITPAEVLAKLKAGNVRFTSGELRKSNYSKLIKATESAQYPEALVLSCIDSRAPPELVFDQTIGNIFVSRVAGEVISPDILAGMEYATAVIGSKLIVVMGHGNCGAVSAACKQVELGHITNLLNKIQPAVAQTKHQMPGESCNDLKYIDQITINNVKNIVNEIPKKSSIINELVSTGQVEIIGAMYNIDSGKVEFFD